MSAIEEARTAVANAANMWSETTSAAYATAAAMLAVAEQQRLANRLEIIRLTHAYDPEAVGEDLYDEVNR